MFHRKPPGQEEGGPSSTDPHLHPHAPQTSKSGSKQRHRLSRDRGNNSAIGGVLSFFGLATTHQKVRIGVVGESENDGEGGHLGGGNGLGLRRSKGRKSMSGSAFNLYDEDDSDEDDDDEDVEEGGRYGAGGGSGRGSGGGGDTLLERGYHEGEEPFLYDAETGKLTDATGATTTTTITTITTTHPITHYSTHYNTYYQHPHSNTLEHTIKQYQNSFNFLCNTRLSLISTLPLSLTSTLPFSPTSTLPLSYFPADAVILPEGEVGYGHSYGSSLAGGGGGGSGGGGKKVSRTVVKRLQSDGPRLDDEAIAPGQGLGPGLGVAQGPGLGLTEGVLSPLHREMSSGRGGGAPSPLSSTRSPTRPPSERRFLAAGR